MNMKSTPITPSLHRNACGRTVVGRGYMVTNGQLNGRPYKQLSSPEANYIFYKDSGQMITWGKTIEDDAVAFPAPTILDMEVTTKCDGVGGKLCPFCYKANNPNGRSMSFETFKKVFDKMPAVLTQIAFGADSKGTSNPDLLTMMAYAKERGVAPNITIAEIDDTMAESLVGLCGAVAVSRYADKNICYNSVEKLTSRGLQQVNIHMMISEETLQQARETVADIQTDPRLAGVNAIVFLSLKQKGRGVHHNVLSQQHFNELVSECLTKEVNFGFDSCSSLKFFQSLTNEQYLQYKGVIQPCESTLESSYINVDGEFFPCSFTEGTAGWEKGIDVVNCDDFITDVWQNDRVVQFRNALTHTACNNQFDCRHCPIYNV
jgi:hypothetical protein